MRVNSIDQPSFCGYNWGKYYQNRHDFVLHLSDKYINPTDNGTVGSCAGENDG